MACSHCNSNDPHTHFNPQKTKELNVWHIHKILRAWTSLKTTLSYICGFISFLCTLLHVEEKIKINSEETIDGHNNMCIYIYIYILILWLRAKLGQAKPTNSLSDRININWSLMDVNKSSTTLNSPISWVES